MAERETLKPTVPPHTMGQLLEGGVQVASRVRVSGMASSYKKEEGE